ncbi:MAG: hypothetical protein GX160_08335, partial [Clostridiales bacterium]|nr:hypothetical protein [Clostridiales bacterium]
MNHLIWHTQSKEEVEKALETSFEKGLSEEEVAKRLEKYGSNELEHKKRRTIRDMVIDQFKDIMIILLSIAAIVSGLLGEITDTIIKL